MIKTPMLKIWGQDQLLDDTKKKHIDINNIIHSEINEAEVISKEPDQFVGAKVMLWSKLDDAWGLVNEWCNYWDYKIMWPY